MEKKLCLKKVKREESGLFEREINKKEKYKENEKLPHGKIILSLFLPHLTPTRNSHDFIIFRLLRKAELAKWNRFP